MSLVGRVEGFFAAGGPLSEVKAGYAPRGEQVRYAVEVARAIEAGAGGRASVLLADCPTGTGKTLASLVAPVLAGSDVVYSTATKALQAQLVEEELPLLAWAMEVAGEEPLTYGLLKGRGNFLCGDRFAAYRRGAGLLDGPAVEELGRWALGSGGGDRDRLDFAVPFWREVASDADDCAPGACAHREGCFYYAHKEAVEGCRVLVVNHSLAIRNVAARGALFGMAGKVLVLDEAHRLEEVLAGAFGAQVSRRRVRYVARAAVRRAPESAAFAQAVEAAADGFFEELRGESEVDAGRPPASFGRLSEGLRSLRNVLSTDPREEANKAAALVAKLRADLLVFYGEREDPGEGRDPYARAIVAGAPAPGAGPPAPPELRSWLVETGLAFVRGVAEREAGGATVLCSATLSAAGSFGHARRRLGLRLLEAGGEARVAEHQASEVFDYPNNCLLYVEDGGVPEPRPGNEDEYTLACVRRTEELLGASRGRALVLLSTARAVEAFRGHLEAPYPVRYQGEAGIGTLVAWLRRTEGAVLIGTRSLWEGISIPGPQVSLVVLDKTPFPNPSDPYVKELSERAAGDWFRAVSLPKAQVALRQGAGRLLRASGDRGVVALLDPRLRSRRWGPRVLRSLPEAPVTGSVAAVEAFFAREGSLRA